MAGKSVLKHHRSEMNRGNRHYLITNNEIGKNMKEIIIIIMKNMYLVERELHWHFKNMSSV
jgi:hypothetical protein